MRLPRHREQVRLASILTALRRAGWDVTSVGIYSAGLFPAAEQGPDDLLLDETLSSGVRDQPFANLEVARRAAQDRVIVAQLRTLVVSTAPDIIHLEQPWDWPLLQEALPTAGR